MSAVESVEEDAPRAVMVRDIDLGFLEEEAKRIPSLKLAMPLEELVKANEPHSRSKDQPRPLNVFFLFRKNWLATHRPRYEEAGENMPIQKVTPFIKKDWDNSSSSVRQFFQWAEKCHKDKHKERYPDYQFKRDGLGKKKRRRLRTTAGTESVAGPRKRKTTDTKLAEPAKRNKIGHDDVPDDIPDIPDDIPDDVPDDDHGNDPGHDKNGDDYGDDEGARTDPETWIMTTTNILNPPHQNGAYIDTFVYSTHEYTPDREAVMFDNDNAKIDVSMISNAVHGNDNDNVAGMGDIGIGGAFGMALYQQIAEYSRVVKEISPLEPYDTNQLNFFEAQSAFNNQTADSDRWEPIGASSIIPLEATTYDVDYNVVPAVNNQTATTLIGDSDIWEPIGARSIVPLEATCDVDYNVVPADEEAMSDFMGTPSSCFSSFPQTPVDNGTDMDLIARELFDFTLYPSPTIEPRTIG